MITSGHLATKDAGSILRKPNYSDFHISKMAFDCCSAWQHIFQFVSPVFLPFAGSWISFCFILKVSLPKPGSWLLSSHYWPFLIAAHQQWQDGTPSRNFTHLFNFFISYYNTVSVISYHKGVLSFTYFFQYVETNFYFTIFIPFLSIKFQQHILLN